MDFSEAKQVGDEGERLVAAELERIAAQYGLTALNDLLLEVRPMTAQLDHLVIDRYGVLIIESKVRRGALIRGSDVQKKWTACYPGRTNVSFQNPLAQNREHENLVRQVLKQAGSPLDPDFVKSAVVFAEADLSHLELDRLAQSRVVDLAGVEGLIKARHDFAVNGGDLSETDVATLAGLFRGLDRSNDPRTQAEHVAYRSEMRGMSANSTYSRDGRRGARSGYRSRSTRTVASSAPPYSKPSLVDQVVQYLADLSLRMALLAAAVAVFWWLFMGPGWPLLTKFLSFGFGASETAASAPTPPAGPTVADAQAALQAIDPAKYAALADPDSPDVTQVEQGTTFTWEYVQVSGSTAQVKTIAVTLDASGQVVGVNIE